LDIVGVFGRQFRDHGESLIHTVAIGLDDSRDLRGRVARPGVELRMLDMLSEVRQLALVPSDGGGLLGPALGDGDERGASRTVDKWSVVNSLGGGT
jgi:hypothetical protein